MSSETKSSVQKMKCVLREQIDAMNVSVRGLFGEQEEGDSDTPSYSTADNFIRKGSGHIDTAWLICQRMGLTLDDAFIPDDMSFEEVVEKRKRRENAERLICELSDLIIGKGMIQTIFDLAEVLLQFGQSISTFGFKEKGAQIIRIAGEAIKKDTMNEERGDDCENG